MNNAVVRTWHTYIGLVTAPSLIFFCLTGALQLFNLHEAHGSFRPFELVEKLSSVHKDQVLESSDEHEHEHEPAAGAAESSADHPDEEKPPSLAVWVLKVFFLVVALGLTTSASLGVWIALSQNRRQRLCWALLATGTVVPLALVALG